MNVGEASAGGSSSGGGSRAGPGRGRELEVRMAWISLSSAVVSKSRTTHPRPGRFSGSSNTEVSTERVGLDEDRSAWGSAGTWAVGDTAGGAVGESGGVAASWGGWTSG
jgi:hypothetical protein